MANRDNLGRFTTQPQRAVSRIARMMRGERIERDPGRPTVEIKLNPANKGAPKWPGK